MRTYEIRYRGITAADHGMVERVEADRLTDRAGFVDFEVCEDTMREVWRVVLRIRHDDVLQIRDSGQAP